MRGNLIFVAGADFDARQEIRDLAARVEAEQRHRGYYSALRLLLDLALRGFDPEEQGTLLEPTGMEDVLLFEDTGLRLAFDVPANGRYATPAPALLAAEFCDLDRGRRATSRPAFIAKANRRRLTGNRTIWSLVKQ